MAELSLCCHVTRIHDLLQGLALIRSKQEGPFNGSLRRADAMCP